MTKPTFIGIGVQKCATSWLHEVLEVHPDIFASDPKEVDFFTYNFDRGYEWFERFFDGAGDAIAAGETSPSYFYHPDVPARIRAYRDDMKIVVIFRDPVERAYSNHLHEVRKGHFTSSLDFRAGLDNNPCYVDQGLYAKHFERWLAHFDRDRILVLISEELSEAPDREMRRVYDFLGVDPERAASLSRMRSNESVAFRFRHTQELLQRGGRMLRRSGYGAQLERLKDAPGVRHVLRANKQDLRVVVPPLDDASRAYLVRRFAGDTQRLAALIGRSSLPWKSFEAADGPAATETRRREAV